MARSLAFSGGLATTLALLGVASAFLGGAYGQVGWQVVGLLFDQQGSTERAEQVGAGIEGRVTKQHARVPQALGRWSSAARQAELSSEGPSQWRRAQACCCAPGHCCLCWSWRVQIGDGLPVAVSLLAIAMGLNLLEVSCF